ncbi:LOW QUALITY PROTEIN: separin [Chelonus insularis]|uniref:LOW QUALITY PROTEIN: separin n=1 Tax=Chelonus insularis TaxID=460826 RepID=UPI001589EC3B|nr:LOW QUALITY PROTEIN: separin [Chelonus insularis]
MHNQKFVYRILTDCTPTSDFKDNYKSLLRNTNLDNLTDDLEKHINHPNVNKCSLHYTTLNKLLASILLAKGEEVKAINRLTEAHAVIHRRQVEFRYKKCELRQQFNLAAKDFGVNPDYMSFDVNSINGPNSLKSKLEELPPEWYMVQLTIPYEQSNKYGTKSVTHQLHITIMPTGKNEIDPFCITLPKPNTNMYDICKIVKELLERNKTELNTEYKSQVLYWKMREKQNKAMETAVTEMEKTWLREWRILLIADLLNPSEIVDDIHRMIDKLLDDDPTGKIVSETKWLLKKIATCSFCLDKNEISRAVQYVLPKHSKLVKNIELSIQGRQKEIATLETMKRKILVLVIDENMDYLPIEKMTILSRQPVTRFSCVQLAYAMFKEHESTIVDGCKIITLDETEGTFIVNPSNNLPKMEKRLKLFMNYWLPKWKGVYNEKPDEETFSNALTNHNALMYSGHGSGIQYFPGEDIERLRVKATALLFGCSSIKLLPVGGKFPPNGVCNQYLTACSPCVLGMLWEVTDGDTDKMTVSFMSTWIPSSAPRPWTCVDLELWCQGTMKFKKPSEITEKTPSYEPELLRAFAQAKECCTQYMTAAAAVVRGLPVKLKY